MDRNAFFGLAYGFVAGFTLGVCCAIAIVQTGIRRNAVQHGAARYVCDPETGKTTFEWLTKPKGERE